MQPEQQVEACASEWSERLLMGVVMVAMVLSLVGFMRA